MLSLIKKCEKCELYKNQRPLLDKFKESDIFWVGLSAKRVNDVDQCGPLAADTISGALLREVEANCPMVQAYNTNIVKCLPLDGNGKLRYPTMKEMDLCFDNLLLEINLIKPKIVFLLGEKVKKIFEKKLDLKFSRVDKYDYHWEKHEDVFYVYIQHPSYISVYKKDQKEEYIKGVKKMIDELLK